MPEIIINEFRRDGQFLGDESIEFVLTQDVTASQLQSYFFGDSTAATADKNSAYQFTNLASIATIFKAGTIIAVGGSNAIPANETNYNPQPGGTDDDWNIQLRIDNGSGGAFLNNVLVGSNPLGGDFAATDVVWIDQSSAGITSVDSINWDSTPGTLGAAAKVQIIAPSNPGNVEFSNCLTGLNVSGNYSVDSAGSLGLPNSGINTTWINSLRNPTTPINFTGQVTFPANSTISGTQVGGLSGITYAGGNTYYIISDARNSGITSPGAPRFYTATIDASTASVALTNVTNLGNPPINNSNVSDTEGIAFVGGNIYISSEGISSSNSQPFINQFDLTGTQTASLPISFPKYEVSPSTINGIRDNQSFESLTVTPSTNFLFTATENALEQDGPASTATNGTGSRILRYNLPAGTVSAEFLYNTDNGNGISEMLALDDNTLLVLERSMNPLAGWGGLKLYQISLSGATDISSLNPLSGSPNAVSKTLVADFASGCFPLDNFEGMTFGPALPNGKRSLTLVSDNNFGAFVNLPTRFAFLAANHAPVLDNTFSPQLTAINEDLPVASNSGTLVSNFIAGTITDPDLTDTQGIAVTATDETNGTWQYSTDGGGTWTSFGSPSIAAARLLSGSDQIRFLPNADYFGSTTFSYQAWDGTTGTRGGTVNLSSPSSVGGVMSFSSETETASITINPVNDPPSFTGGPGQSVPHDSGPQTVTGWATNLSSGPANEAGQILTFQVVNNSNSLLFAAGPPVKRREISRIHQRPGPQVAPR